MSKRGAFGSGSKADQGARRFNQRTEQDRVNGTLHQLALTQLEPDPQNPRQLKVDPSTETLEQLSGVTVEDDPWVDTKRSELEELAELTEAIRHYGVIQPITVYEHGERYRIAYGERRYWGAWLAANEVIPAVVLPAKPNFLKTHQLIENIQRSQLRPPDYLSNIEAVIEEHNTTDGRPIENGSQLASVIGLNPRNGQRLWKVIHTPDVREAVDAGYLRTVSDAITVAELFDDPDQRAKVIDHARNNEGRLPERRRRESSPQTKQTAGRPKTATNLGRIDNPSTLEAVVTGLAQRIGRMDLVEDVEDWSDYKRVEQVWKALVKEVPGS